MTVVLIGARTAGRKWIDYEIRKSAERGNGFLGVRIHKLRDWFRRRDSPGCNPFENHKLRGYGRLSGPPIYDWVDDDGRRSIDAWIEAAAKLAGR